MEALKEKYKHIKGWGIDADPANEPNYPYKHYTGADHERLNWQRPPLQPQGDIEVLQSTEHLRRPATFGTSSPPSGLSGAIRKMAFHFSENRLRHWFPLVLADRVNMVEGIIDDLAHGYVPNIFAERGWNAEWKYNRKNFVAKIAIGAAVATAVTAAIIYSRRRSRQSEN